MAEQRVVINFGNPDSDTDTDASRDDDYFRIEADTDKSPSIQRPYYFRVITNLEYVIKTSCGSTARKGRDLTRDANEELNYVYQKENQITYPPSSTNIGITWLCKHPGAHPKIAGRTISFDREVIGIAAVDYKYLCDRWELASVGLNKVLVVALDKDEKEVLGSMSLEFTDETGTDDDEEDDEYPAKCSAIRTEYTNNEGLIEFKVYGVNPRVIKSDTGEDVEYRTDIDPLKEGFEESVSEEVVFKEGLASLELPAVDKPEILRWITPNIHAFDASSSLFAAMRTNLVEVGEFVDNPEKHRTVSAELRYTTLYYPWTTTVPADWASDTFLLHLEFNDCPPMEVEINLLEPDEEEPEDGDPESAGESVDVTVYFYSADDGTPATGVTVQLFGAPDGDLTAITDSEGKVLFENLERGETYDIEADSDVYTHNLEDTDRNNDKIYVPLSAL